MAANRGAINYVLPVNGKSQIDQHLQQRIPDALYSAAPEPGINRVSLAINYHIFRTCLNALFENNALLAVLSPK